MAINEIVGLLSQFAPDSLKELKESHPGEEELVPGLIAGPPPSAKERKLLAMRAEAAGRGMREATRLSDRTVAHARRRIAKIRHLEFWAEVAAMAGSGSTMGSVGVGLPAAVSMASAFVAFAGSVTALLARHSARGYDSSGSGLLTLYEKLLAARPEARQIADYLTSWLDAGRPESATDEVEESIRRANAIAATVFQAVRSLPEPLIRELKGVGP